MQINISLFFCARAVLDSTSLVGRRSFIGIKILLHFSSALLRCLCEKL